jgi:hypothetical protein
MRKWAKLTIIITVAVIITPLACWGLLHLMIWLYHLGPVHGKYYLCAPEELIVKLEDIFGHKFPDGITEIKAAKTHWEEGNVSFLIRFTAEPNVVDAFVNSFPGEVAFEEYAPSKEMRPNLSWFKKPIQKGKIGFPSINRSAPGFSIIFIDITNEKLYIVYMFGHYYR